MLVINLVAVGMVILCTLLSVKITRQYERAVVFRLGRLLGEKGPGLFCIIPFVDRIVRVDLRTRQLDVPQQTIITRDNISADVDAIIYYHVTHASEAIVNVEDYEGAAALIAQTMLRDVLGQSDLDMILLDRWGRGGVNVEAYIAARPDMVFVGGEPGADLSRIALTREKFGSVPVVCVDNTRNATGYAETIRFMGDVLGVPDRADVLIAYYEDVLKEVTNRVSRIPEQHRKRVYYAEGNNGLSTDPRGSVHSQLIELCGGINVTSCKIASGSGMTPVTLESILMWQPQVMITTNENFSKQVVTDDTWKNIPAVVNRDIHLTPRLPFNWFDRPPGVNRIVGIPWTAHLPYPDIFTRDWVETKVKQFYAVFYHYALNDHELESLLND